TRWPRDWSSDVCSSDLGDRVFAGIARGAGLLIVLALAGVFVFLAIEGIPGINQAVATYAPRDGFLDYIGPLVFGTVLAAVLALRSEERRVGKGCRCGGA